MLVEVEPVEAEPGHQGNHDRDDHKAQPVHEVAYGTKHRRFLSVLASSSLAG